MNIIMILIVLCFIGGCSTRHEASNEPDTEYILSQYNGQDEAVVNARRIKEGW